MTETPQQEHGAAAPDDGVRTDHLRDYEQLRRSISDRKVAGVAGGLGRHLNLDPTILRVAFVVLTLFGGAGAVLYGVAWLVVPEEGSNRAVLDTRSRTRNILLLVGAVVAGSLVISHSWGGFGFPWPLVVLGLVGFVVMMSRDRAVHQAPPTPADTSPGPVAQTVTDPDGAELTAPYAPLGAPVRPGAPPPWMPPVAQASAPQPKPDRGPRLFGFTLAFVALALGSLGLYDAAGGHVLHSAYPALALAVIGVMLVVGSWAGRPGGLIFLGLVATVALAVSSVLSSGITDARTVTATPMYAAAVHSSYTVTSGRMTLDLRHVTDPQQLAGRLVSVSARFGEVRVLLPRDLRAHVEANVRFGDVDIANSHHGGPQVHVSRDVGPGFRVGTGTVPQIDLDLRVDVGHIEVRQS